MSNDTQAYGVTCHDGDEANGVANILSMLLAQNLVAKPELVDVARRMSRPVAVISTDTGTEATIEFGPDGVLLRNGVHGNPSVTVRATVDQILDVSQLAMRAGGLLPVGFFTGRGMKVLGQILTHKLVVKGLLTHTVTALRTIALLSVAD